MSSGSSTAFSRLDRPGSGRLLTNPDGTAEKTTWGSRSSTPASLSPSSPSGGLVPEHRVRPSGLSLPAPGGGLIPDALMSPEQQEKRQGLKISFSTPNMRKAAALASAANPTASSSEEKSRLLMRKSAHSTGRLVLGPNEFDFKAEDLQVQSRRSAQGSFD